MSETTSHVPVAPHYPQYPPPPPGVRPDLAFTPVPRPPRDTKRRWPALVGVAVASAAVAATVTALITSQVVRTDTAGRATAPAVTVTATPSAPAPPAPLPTAQADRQTCNAWLAAGVKIHDAANVISVIPEGLTVLDQAVRDNPEWSAAVRRAADLYGQAGDVLAAGIAPGATLILDRAATTAASALRTLSAADATLDPANGNAFDEWKQTANTVNVLCDRLAPR